MVIGHWALGIGKKELFAKSSASRLNGGNLRTALAPLVPLSPAPPAPPAPPSPYPPVQASLGDE
uniref:hypothetical protein n=1 Tax=Hassallia byssoidea TaxID=482630 RepID=UPI0013D5CB68|nr:hypothetical protein [Hassalia byssoidea]